MKKLAIGLFLFCSANLTFAQQQPKPSPEPTVDVVRVDTNLVQTNVTVLDKQGKFVDGLRQEDFQLRVEGKPVAISFFSRITAGTNQERSQLAALKGGPAAAPVVSDAQVRGRVVLFFIDDLHLSQGSVVKTRQMITDFIVNKMGPSDLAAVASASGQIGFLQQLTDNKAVLHAAINRLSHRPYVVRDNEQVAMTEYAALRIDQGDSDTLTYYATEILKATNMRSAGGPLGPPSGGPVGAAAGREQRNATIGVSRQMAERQVKERASTMLRQSTAVTANMISGLESLVRTLAQQNGRKLIFFVSDGFYLNDKNTGFANRFREVIDSAVRTGVVIYSLDARGLTSTIDMGSNRGDPEGHLSRSNVGELSSSQDGMNMLAVDTGGRALFNTDALNNAVDRALSETSNYYLLAWKPTSEEQKALGFRKIEVSVGGRTDLSIRFPKGYLANPPSASTTSTPSVTTTESNTAKTPATDKPADVDLRRALSASSSQENIPISVSASFVDAPGSGAIVTAGVQTQATALNYGSDGKQAAVDVAGVILNDQGKVAESFRTRLAVDALPAQYSGQDTVVAYNYKAKLTPGLYQIRAAIRDEKSARVASASQWIEIPDLSSRKLTLSSLLVRSTKKGETLNSAANQQFSVDRLFPRSSQLNFLVFIYNASTGNPAPDVTAQVEVFRNGATVVNTTPRKLPMEGMTDLARIPYAGQFPLESLPTGRYELQITISDRLAKTSASQRISFQVQ